MAGDRDNLNTRTVVFAHPRNLSQYFSARVPVGSLNEEIIDAAFVKAVGGDHYPGGLAVMRHDLRFARKVPLGQNWAYKYLIDIDGMSYSARFMAFLASDSVPVKSTVYREYFEDWIQPWCVCQCP
jgi:hypothetical protein